MLVLLADNLRLLFSLFSQLPPEALAGELWERIELSDAADSPFKVFVSTLILALALTLAPCPRAHKGWGWVVRVRGQTARGCSREALFVRSAGVQPTRALFGWALSQARGHGSVGEPQLAPNERTSSNKSKQQPHLNQGEDSPTHTHTHITHTRGARG